MDDLKNPKIDLEAWKLPLSKQVRRSSTPRVEKGTAKVVDHDVKEQASTLLYALLYLCNKPYGETKVVSANYAARVAKDVENVVADFGLDKDRLRLAGEKMGTDIIAEAERAENLAAFEAEYKSLGLKLEAMKKSRLTDRDPSSEPNNSTEPLTNKDRPSTRRGVTLKRDREVEDAEECVNGIMNIIKSMKTGKEGGRLRRPA